MYASTPVLPQYILERICLGFLCVCITSLPLLSIDDLESGQSGYVSIRSFFELSSILNTVNFSKLWSIV